MTKIIELRASGFARLSAVTIRPDGALVQITGKNGQGKTSCLNAIWTALKGRAAAPVQPINKNAEEARLQLDLGTMVVTRTFRRSGKSDDVTSDLRVTMADGSRVGAKPQALIDAMLGDLSFNPLEFARLPAKEQFDRIKALVPDFDFDDNQAQRDEAFAKRTDANRDAKNARARAQGVVLPPGPKPKVPDTDDLVARLRAATVTNNAHADKRAQRLQMADAIEAKLDESERLVARAEALSREAKAAAAELGKLPAVPADIDTVKIAGEIASSDGLRQIAARHDERARHQQEAEEAERLSETLTALIGTCDAEKREAIEAAEMPVPGLSIGDGVVLLNDLPFSQAGTAEKIEASVGIGMALNPDLRVMLIDEGSELDSDSLESIAKLALLMDYQVWCCRVEESGKVGFVIEDGALKESGQ